VASEKKKHTVGSQERPSSL